MVDPQKGGFTGSSSMAYGIKDNAFAYLLLIYANNCLGVPGYLSGGALAIALLWDAVTDPVLGHWSDKSNTRLGRRHPFMYASLFLLPGAFYALFNPVISFIILRDRSINLRFLADKSIILF